MISPGIQDNPTPPPPTRELVRMGLEGFVATLACGVILYGGYMVFVRLMRLLAGEG